MVGEEVVGLSGEISRLIGSAGQNGPLISKENFERRPHLFRSWEMVA